MAESRPDDEQAESRQLDDEEVGEIAGGVVGTRVLVPELDSPTLPGTHGCC